MKKEGIDEEELKEWGKQRISEIFNLHDPISITNVKDNGDKNVKSEESIRSEYKDLDEQEEIVNYVETDNEIIKILVESKDSLFKNSPAGKAYIDYIIDHLGNDDSARFTNREIAESIGCNEKTIRWARKKLSKNIPLLWELLT